MYLITMGAIFLHLTRVLGKGNKHGCDTFVDLILTSKSGLHDTIFYNHNHNRVPQNSLIHPGLTGKRSWYSYSIARTPKGRETSPINPVIIKTSVMKVFCILFFILKRSHLTLRYNKMIEKQLRYRMKKSSITSMTYTRWVASFFD